MTSKRITPEYMIFTEKKGGWGVYQDSSSRADSTHTTEEQATEAAHKAQAYLEKRRAESAATQATNEARYQAAERAAQAPELATDRQVSYILDLIHQGRHEEGGFITGPTTREGVEQMTKVAASTYINSLTGNY